LPVDWGYGAVCDPVSGSIIEGVTVSSTNQEHGLITSRSGEVDFDRFSMGSRVKILPNHSCATAAAYDRYFVTNGSEDVVDVWERVNGW
jgi:D-serine deaminase-like pyridoxal phosphate-dependent protein